MGRNGRIAERCTARNTELVGDAGQRAAIRTRAWSGDLGFCRDHGDRLLYVPGLLHSRRPHYAGRLTENVPCAHGTREAASGTQNAPPVYSRSGVAAAIRHSTDGNYPNSSRPYRNAPSARSGLAPPSHKRTLLGMVPVAPDGLVFKSPFQNRLGEGGQAQFAPRTAQDEPVPDGIGCWPLRRASCDGPELTGHLQ